jgi:hypothetical protein
MNLRQVDSIAPALGLTEMVSGGVHVLLAA